MNYLNRKPSRAKFLINAISNERNEIIWYSAMLQVNNRDVTGRHNAINFNTAPIHSLQQLYEHLRFPLRCN